MKTEHLMQQASLFEASVEPEAADSDSWCTPPEVMDIAHRMWPRGIALDPCANLSSIAMGFVRARTAWRKADDCTSKPSWSIPSEKRTEMTCWLQPPYSREGAPIIDHFISRWSQGEMWEAMALVRLDTSTEWWAALEAHSTSLVLFGDRLDHYDNGERRGSSNFCSALHFFTRADVMVRRRALTATVGSMGWVK